MENWNVRVNEIASLTIGKKDNPTWREYHNHRLNAEHFGILDNLYQTHREPTYDNKDYWNVRRDANEWTQPKITLEEEWANEHIKEAMVLYEKETSQKVHETGIWIFPNGFASASPDGLLKDPLKEDRNIGCILIKCPLEVRDARPIKPAQSIRDIVYIDGQNNLLTKHAFYHEVQGCLMATQAEWCDFILWSPNFLSIHRLLPDQKWQEETFNNISYVYKLYLLRREDRRYWNYRREPEKMEEVDLSKLFEPASREKKKIRKTFKYCLACHIGRWIYFLSRNAHVMAYWQEKCDQFWNEAKSLICERCMVNNFIFLWKEKNPKEEALPQEIEEIKNQKWQIPKDIMDEAALRVKKLGIDNGIFCEPCKCLKW